MNFKNLFLTFVLGVFCVGCAQDSAKESNYSQVRLQNDSYNEISQFYIRKNGTSNWGSDLIDGSKVLPAHAVSDFTVADCDEYYDFKAATFMGGKVWTSTQPVFCECGKIIKFIITDTKGKRSLIEFDDEYTEDVTMEEDILSDDME